MRDEDVVARLPIAASLPTGTPVSKYFRNLDVEIFMRNALEGIEESKEQEDPIMAKFTEERAGISKDELIARRQRLLELNEDAESNGEEFGDADIRKSASLEGDQEGEDPSGQIADGLPTPSQSQESEEERQIREQEEKLAALGVTGFAKPVRTSIRRSVVPAAQTLSRGREQLTNSSSDAHRNALHVPIEVSEQATVDAFSSNILDNHRPNPFNDADGKGYSRRESPAGNYRNSLQTPPTSASHDSRCDNDQLYPRRSSSNSAENSLQELPANIKNIQPDPSGPRTPDTIQRDGGDKNAHSPSHTRGTMTADDKRGSPLQEQFHDHGNGGIVRKRSIRELSPEIAEGPKRQPDGCHAKDKRKAPKVAAAYG